MKLRLKKKKDRVTKRKDDMEPKKWEDPTQNRDEGNVPTAGDQDNPCAVPGGAAGPHWSKKIACSVRESPESTAVTSFHTAFGRCRQTQSQRKVSKWKINEVIINSRK